MITRSEIVGVGLMAIVAALIVNPLATGRAVSAAIDFVGRVEIALVRR